MAQSMKHFLTPVTDNVVSLLSRSLASEWPYDPQQIEYRKHPSMHNRFTVISRFIVMPGDDERSTQIAVEIVRRSARLRLKDRDVRHFEVIPLRLDDHTSVTHQDCRGEGCDACEDLGVLFHPSDGDYVPLMGWLAVAYVER